jgi:hypothetical protein
MHWPIKTIEQRLGISIIYRKYASFEGTEFVPLTWNAGIVEQWNNGQKRITSEFGLRLVVI